MGCIEDLKYETILSSATFRECRTYVETNFREFYLVELGYRIFEEYIIGVPPIAIGIDGASVIFPYTKPCHGTFLLKIEGPEEIDRLRTQHKKKRVSKSTVIR